MSTALASSEPTRAAPNAIAHEIIDALAAHGVEATPKSYAVWYAFRTGADARLTAKLDERLASAARPTAEFLLDLHDEFLSDDEGQAQAASAGERIVKELGDLLGVLRTSGAKADAYAETLHETSCSLRDGLDAKALRDIVSGLAAATVDMAEHNRKLTEKLRESSREMDLMRGTLAKARAEAMTDVLTGLANRKMMNETLSLRLREAAAQGSPLTFLMCDIDSFKRFNDTWGHQTGDQIIRFIASALSRQALPDYLCARYGGEEFSMIMPRTTLQEAHALAEALRTTIESKKLFRKSTNEDLGRVTISVGIAQWRPDESREALIERADGCLYASKRSGRNRVTVDRQLGARSAA